ncbi:putative late blight resistance protein homolog R1A-3 [Coffea eugenioides]|uniref:putative late blight resistance protein homolog R1A-3 n=1 Tax=Coffea eugenioides TaxID=49369 RepID=UPI000F60B3B8|nr:putative late blight resistance protein homolog R1A-3 [Coffea eugenioides]
MASCCLTCISAILDDLQLLENLCPKTPAWKSELFEMMSLKIYLGIFRTFLLCLRKWGDDDDANLGALVVRMKDYISKLGQAIHKFYLTSVEDGYRMKLAAHIPDDLEEEASSLVEEIKDLKYLTRLSSKSPVKKDDLMDIMDSLLESPRYIVYLAENQSLYAGYAELSEHFAEKLTFLKNFLCFLTLHGFEDTQLGPLLTHIKSVAINAACNNGVLFSKSSMSRNNLIWYLLQEIIFAEPEVYKTCVQALISSKLSRQAYKEKDENIFRDFIDSLLVYLWEILKTGTCIMISLKDRLKMLYDGLRSLRIILKENPNNFDEKMRDLTGLLLCDAGLVIFSLSLNVIKDGSVKEMDLESFHDFLKRIKLFKAIVAEKYPETSPSSEFPRTNELGFIDFLLKYMEDLTNPDAHSVALSNYPIHAIHEELVYLHSSLGRNVELRNEDRELQALWDRVVEVAYKVEFLIDSLLVGDILDSSSISFDSIVEEIKIIKAAALNIFDKKTLDLNVKEVTKRPNNMPSQGSMPIINDMIVGLEDEATSIINRLTRGSSQLQIIPIVGMPGLGKTTLAKKVYNDSSVMSHFYARAWCTVSQTYHKKNLLLQILTSIHTKLHDKFVEMSEEDLAQEVKRGLLRTKYLIVLDDIWDTEAWNALEASFPDNRNGSRVIMTSRNRDLAALRGELDEGPHFLRPLTADESWDLLSKRLFPGKDLPPPELCELRMQTVEMCQGLPLTIVILAGILANEDQYSWKKVVEGLNSSMLSSTEQCTAALELSYNNLPDYLKSCFLYFGAFPEDHEHTTERLNWLWVAEGFTQKTQFKSAEDVANDFLMDLIHRSLVIVSKQRSIGGVKACRVHDLLHEFCVTKGKEENFLQLVRGYDEIYTFRVPRNLRRLCINSNPAHFCKSRLFAPTIRSLIHSDGGKRYRRLALESSSMFGIFKLVRVLELSNIYLGTTFPRELELLVQLRYLAILGNMDSIPSSIANLSILETFILKTFVGTVLLPDTIWNLKKLRHLQNSCLFLLPTDNLDTAANLCDLNTFSSVSFSSLDIVRKVFSKIPTINKLKCIFVVENEHNWVSADKIPVLDYPSGLESLNLMFNHYTSLPCQFEFQFPLAIRKLTLCGFLFPWSKISAIENLPNLEVLKLLRDAFDGEIWNVEKEGFPKVRFLKIAALDIVKWTAYEGVDSFPSLQKLVLINCRSLKEISSCLGSSTLEIIEASDCPYSASFIKPLQEEQMDLGNADLKILIS